MFSFRRKRAPSVTLGTRGFFPFVRPVVLTGKELAKHKHIQGTSGQGKSKLNVHLATSLIAQGIPCSVIDPHADLVHDIIALLFDRGFFSHPQAFTKLLYIEFNHPERVIPFNVLKQPHQPISITVRNLIEACKRTWPSLADGAAPQFENVLQYTAVVLAENGLPITYAEKLLTHADFRESLLSRCTSQPAHTFFHDRFGRWDKRDQAHNIESTLNKLSILTFSDPLLYALGHADNLLDFRQLMDSGVSVLFNLGTLDAETRHLLGSLIMVGFEQATLSRANIREEERLPYHLLIDEFPQFSSRSEDAFTTFLSEARKFHVTLTLSHQTTSQLSERFHDALQNALPIIFQLGRTDALAAAEIFGRYDPHRVKHTVADETQVDRTHPVFWGLVEQFEEMARAIEDLQVREAFIKLGGRSGKRQTIKFRSLTVPPTHASLADIQQIRDSYASRLLAPKTAMPQPEMISPNEPPPRWA